MTCKLTHKENLIFNDDYVRYVTSLDLDGILGTRLGKTIYPPPPPPPQKKEKEIYRNNNPKKG